MLLPCRRPLSSAQPPIALNLLCLVWKIEQVPSLYTALPMVGLFPAVQPHPITRHSPYKSDWDWDVQGRVLVEFASLYVDVSVHVPISHP